MCWKTIKCRTEASKRRQAEALRAEACNAEEAEFGIEPLEGCIELQLLAKAEREIIAQLIKSPRDEQTPQAASENKPVDAEPALQEQAAAETPHVREAGAVKALLKNPLGQAEQDFSPRTAARIFTHLNNARIGAQELGPAKEKYLAEASNTPQIAHQDKAPTAGAGTIQLEVRAGGGWHRSRDATQLLAGEARREVQEAEAETAAHEKLSEPSIPAEGVHQACWTTTATIESAGNPREGLPQGEPAATRWHNQHARVGEARVQPPMGIVGGVQPPPFSILYLPPTCFSPHPPPYAMPMTPQW